MDYRIDGRMKDVMKELERRGEKTGGRFEGSGNEG